MKRFSIDEWLKDPKREVRTVDGRPVRVLSECREKDGTRRLIGLLECVDEESGNVYDDLRFFDADGTCWHKTEESIEFVPEKRSRWVFVYTTGETDGKLFTSLPYETREEAEAVIKEINGEVMRLCVKAISEITWEE